MKPVAIIGAGNSGFALTAHLLSEGVPVRMWNRTKDNIYSCIEQAGGIQVEGVITGRFLPDVMTHDIGEAISGCELILVTVPAHAHAPVAAAMAPFVQKGQVILLTPGRTCGALEVTELLRRAGAPVVPVAETQTIIHTCRKESGTSVVILACKQNVAFSALNPAETGRVLEAIPECLQKYLVPAASSLETSLGNVGMVLHCAPVLFNIGWIESTRTQFKYYYEGITPTIAAYLEKLDAERLAVAAACGVRVPSVAEWLRQTYGVSGKSLYECIQNNESYAKIDAPESLRHRYLFEDVPTGLVPVEAIGKALGVPTPIISSVIDLAQRLVETDFRESGRSAAALGLAAGVTAEEAVNVLCGRTGDRVAAG